MTSTNFKTVLHKVLLLILVVATSKAEDCDEPDYMKYTKGGIVAKMTLKPEILKEVITYRTDCMSEAIKDGLDPIMLGNFESEGNRTVTEKFLKFMACVNARAHIFGDFDKMDVTFFDSYVTKDINAEVRKCISKHPRTCFGRVYEAYECYVDIVMNKPKDKKRN